MALTARLQFGDNMVGLYSKEYLVAECHLHFMRHHNHFKPDSDARCNKVELVVIAPDKENPNLYQWYIDNGAKSGRLVFELVANNANKNQILEFEDAYCYSIEEEYDFKISRQRILRLSFVAEKIKINENSFNNLYA